MKYIVLSALLFLSACASTLSEETVIANQTIQGHVVDARTNTPIVSALVVLTLPKGNTWSLPSSYLVGYAYTDSDGKFKIPAQPRQIDDLRRNNSPISVDVYHPDYKQAVDFIAQSNPSHQPLTVKMEEGVGSDLVVTINDKGCTYNNPQICTLVRSYLGL